MGFLEWLRKQFGPKPKPIPPAPTPKPPLSLSETRNSLLKSHNDYRVANGRSALAFSHELNTVAQMWATWMAKTGMLTHEYGDNTMPSRLRAAGYNFTYSGENIAQGTYPVHMVMEMWQDSLPHKRNMLTPSFKEVGFGMAKDVNGLTFWCVNFGTR